LLSLPCPARMPSRSVVTPFCNVPEYKRAPLLRRFLLSLNPFLIFFFPAVFASLHLARKDQCFFCKQPIHGRLSTFPTLSCPLHFLRPSSVLSPCSQANLPEPPLDLRDFPPFEFFFLIFTFAPHISFQIIALSPTFFPPRPPLSPASLKSPHCPGRQNSSPSASQTRCSNRADPPTPCFFF